MNKICAIIKTEGKMKTYKIENNTYELIKDYKNAFDLDAIKERYTEYFEDYDYILGDWSYGKLRLKGFCNKENSKFKEINNIENIDQYIKNNGAYDCKYFILKKIDN